MFVCGGVPMMMRNSALLKWAQNNNKQTVKEGNRNWIHPPDALQRGHIAYLVKFLGNTEVDQPKGITVVKESIRKLKFCQQLRKAEGNKTPKVELTISIDGVAIQTPKTKVIMHQYPLHRISYCADDKGEKKFFSFIAKEADSETHNCFVFVSDKLAEEITLTIGQAFDLAYRRFLETSGKDLEVQRRLVLLTQRNCKLEKEVSVLRQRLNDIAQIKGQSDVEEYMVKNGISDLLTVNHSNSSSSSASSPTPEMSQVEVLASVQSTDNKENGALLNFSSSSSNGFSSTPQLPSASSLQPPPVPPRAFEAPKSSFGDDFMSEQPAVGRKLEGLLLDEIEDFNPRAHEQPVNGSSSPPPLLAPPPKAAREVPRRVFTQNNGSPDIFKEDLFGSTPFNPAASQSHIPPAGTVLPHSSPNPPVACDPFGMGDFGGTSNVGTSQQELENAIGLIDKRILEMKDGFSRGLSFGNDDFSLESLDPLRN
ncbi:PTB domain-containing engulfment adapter protein 1-like isoform X1 [Schistocerca cancellata]|uniref:PTB domain-containing engulfment adapter protein 1-like isoform X1 n=2 Tax=Schistocerca cancellata TaxID=274614 RepID=UPI002118B9B3|nr:PTB domain-containing engulfment adapter protein 1-like isoform X1 [Schistocerca cancellata]